METDTYTYRIPQIKAINNPIIEKIVSQNQIIVETNLLILKQLSKFIIFVPKKD